MYKFTKEFSLNDEFDEWVLGFTLENGTQFKFLDCYYIYKKVEREYNGEKLEISYYDLNDDNQKANEKMNLSLKTLSYITLLPLVSQYSNFENKEAGVGIPLLVNSKSISKVNLLTDIDMQINTLSSEQRVLFDEMMSLHYAGVKFNYLFFNEDSFLSFFKILERLAENEIVKNKTTNNLKTDDNKAKLRQVLDKYLKSCFDINFSGNKLDSFRDKVFSFFINSIEKEVFSQIVYFCNCYKINIEPEQLDKSVKLRNKLAHGEITKMQGCINEYNLTCKLSREFISKKFFDKKYSEIKINCNINPVM